MKLVWSEKTKRLQVSQYHCAPYASEQGFLNTLCTMLPKHTNKASSTLIVFFTTCNHKESTAYMTQYFVQHPKIIHSPWKQYSIVMETKYI
jgi:hypothetical protein